MKQKILKILVIYIFLQIITTSVFAKSVKDSIGNVKYTEEFKNYLQLSEEEKSKILQPSPIKIPNTTAKSKNPLSIYKIVGAGLESSYSLRTVLPNKLKIKDQGITNTCWAFSALESLETNLLLKNPTKTFDFSEKHMNYATSRVFANNEINTNGFNRKITEGGTWQLASAYLTNGTGAINEEQMQFTNDNNLIDLTQIQNKIVTSQVDDIVMFPSLESNDENIEQLKTKMKEHIKAHGSIAAKIHGAQLYTDYYNNSTGAIFCDNKDECPVDHGVSIIGWNDEYDTENFNEKHRPKNKGAWIIKNTWGEVIEDENGPITIGDNGYMYLSYEDVNVYSDLFGITKASENINYENIYQYDFYGMNGVLPVLNQKAFLGEVFNKKTSGKEYLTQVSLYAPEAYTCKVYVNPSSSSIAKSDLRLVQLNAGETESFDAGYHTIEFANPIEITGNTYSVVIEIQGTRESELDIGAEAKEENSWYDVVTIENEKCFVTVEEGFDNNEWIDTSKLSENSSIGGINIDTTIKAFTTSKINNNPNEPEPSPSPKPETSPSPSPSPKPEMSPTPKPSQNPNPSPNVETKPQASKLDSSKCELKKIEGYFYTDLNKQEYVMMNVEVNNIKRYLDDKSNYEYYYYLSSKQNEKNINNWVKINEVQNSSDILTFNIDTRDIANYEEVMNAESLFLYVKEVVSKNGQQVETTSKAMQINGDSDNVEVGLYVDDEKIDEYIPEYGYWDNDYEMENTVNNNYSKDKLANIVIPKAGMYTIIGLIVVITIVGMVIFIRYKVLSKYVK